MHAHTYQRQNNTSRKPKRREIQTRKIIVDKTCSQNILEDAKIYIPIANLSLSKHQTCRFKQITYSKKMVKKIGGKNSCYSSNELRRERAHEFWREIFLIFFFFKLRKVTVLLYFLKKKKH